MYEELDHPAAATNVPPFRAELAYPELTDEMIGRIRTYGRVESFPDQTVLFLRDARQVDMFVILKGNIEVSSLVGPGEETLLQVLNPHQFSGELGLLNSQRTLVSSRTQGENQMASVVSMPLPLESFLSQADPCPSEELHRVG